MIRLPPPTRAIRFSDLAVGANFVALGSAFWWQKTHNGPNTQMNARHPNQWGHPGMYVETHFPPDAQILHVPLLGVLEEVAP